MLWQTSVFVCVDVLGFVCLQRFVVVIVVIWCCEIFDFCVALDLLQGSLTLAKTCEIFDPVKLLTLQEP